jgi:hypothetical protein
LQAFCGAEDLLIPTSCNISHRKTKKHPKTHRSNDLTTISIEIIRNNLQKFTFFFLRFEQKMILPIWK